MVYIANWVIIYYLPPFTGTWKIHWSLSRLRFRAEYRLGFIGCLGHLGESSLWCRESGDDFVSSEGGVVPFGCILSKDNVIYIHPPKKIKFWKMIFLFKWVIFRSHVNFQGCIYIIIYIIIYIYIYLVDRSNMTDGKLPTSTFWLESLVLPPVSRWLANIFNVDASSPPCSWCYSAKFHWEM